MEVDETRQSARDTVGINKTRTQTEQNYAIISKLLVELGTLGIEGHSH